MSEHKYLILVEYPHSFRSGYSLRFSSEEARTEYLASMTITGSWGQDDYTRVELAEVTERVN